MASVARWLARRLTVVRHVLKVDGAAEAQRREVLAHHALGVHLRQAGDHGEIMGRS